jgi:KDO2-lipid IV(A) lauroyltransferase
MVQPSGAEILDRALAEGKGVIVVTAHFSNWDILAAAAAVYGYAVNAVTNELSGGLNRLVIRSRERIGMRMIPVGSSAARRILRALQRNELVALVCDLYRGENGVPVDFFDRPTLLPSGPAALALKTGAPIIPVWVERQPNNGYVARVEAPLEVVRSGNLPADIEATTHRIAAFFERIIRQQPDQWFVFLPLWRQQRVNRSPMQTALKPS